VGEGTAAEQAHAPSRPAPGPAAAPAVERRAASRPLTGKKRPAAAAPAPTRSTNGAAAEEWKDF